MSKQWVLGASVCVFPWVVACGDSSAGKLFGPSGDPGPDGGSCFVGFNQPAPNQVLSLKDDADRDCSNGIQLALEITTDLKDGTAVEVGLTGQREQVSVASGKVTLDSLVLPAAGDSTLEFVVPSDENCGGEVTVTSRCDEKPSCEITVPTKLLLNGAPTPEGDRVSELAAPFRTQVEVATSAPDGEQVLLDTGSDVLLGVATGGIADFPAVVLAPDGEHTLTAECRSGDESATSEALVVTVDSEGPQLGTEDIVPVDGQRFTKVQDAEPQTADIEFDVCVPVQSPDALDLAGGSSNNVCVAIGNQAPDCAAAESGALPSGEDGACVRVECPGSAAFDLDLSITDQAGNKTTHTIRGLTCNTSAPSVQIVNLTDSTTQPDNLSLRLLSSAMPAGQLKDADATVYGAQFDVLACTNAMSGSARLLGGAVGSNPVELGTTSSFTAAAAGDCPSDLAFVVRFPAATLPESVEGPDGALLAMTELHVEVTDSAGETNQSGAVRLWVDSLAPSVALISPTAQELCGAPQDVIADLVQPVRFSSSAYPAQLTAWVLTGSSEGPKSVFTSPNQSQDLLFPLGNHTLVASTTELSGNVGTLPACDVVIGDPAVLTFVRPAADALALNAATNPPALGTYQDGDAVAEGWQGVLELEVANLDAAEAPSASVQFQVNGAAFGAPVPLDSGVVTGDTVTVSLNTNTVPGGIPEGAQVSLGAELLGTTTPASTELELAVDTVRPTAVTNLVPLPSSGAGEHRISRFRLDWVAAGDGPTGADPVAGYRVAFSPGPITTQAAFDLAWGDTDPLTYAGQSPWSGAPAAPGQPESAVVSDLVIERGYFFAVQAVDAALNVGPPVQGVSGQVGVTPAARSQFKTLVLSPPSDLNTEFGFAADGSADLTGDGLAELVVGSSFGNKVYIYKGSASGYAATPLVTIQGPSGVRFGSSVAVVGDLNADTPSSPSAQQSARAIDLVIGASGDKSGPTGAEGRAYVFYGRDWDQVSNQSLSTAANDHDATIDLAMPAGQFGSLQSVQRIGDYNADGADDFALTAPFFDPAGAFTFEGAVFVVFGGTSTQPFASLTLPDAVGARAVAIYGAVNQSLGGTNLGTRPIIGLADLFAAGSSALMVARPFEDALGAYRYAPGASITSADDADSFTGPATSFTGNFGLAVSTGRVLAVANPNHITQFGPGANREGSVDMFTSTASDPLPVPFVRLFDTRSADNFGQVLIGNTFSGRPGSYGLPLAGEPGENDADFALAASTISAGLPIVTIVKGKQLSRLSGQVNLAVATSIPAGSFNLTQMQSPPAGWNGTIGYGIRDMNGDGFMDLALAEFRPRATPAGPPLPISGRIIILY